MRPRQKPVNENPFFHKNILKKEEEEDHHATNNEWTTMPMTMKVSTARTAPVHAAFETAFVASGVAAGYSTHEVNINSRSHANHGSVHAAPTTTMVLIILLGSSYLWTAMSERHVQHSYIEAAHYIH
mmetsp:Transcript_8721/g.16623  ORF Transcript_8721/g.16623 Transcript_8721/m.16623 type:complete len:127 (+) Transcript_8721:1126-1506(+)